MLKFAANLSFMFNEWAFLDRFSAAADAGFSAVEYLFPYEFSPDEIATRLEYHRLTQALYNFYPGDFAAGERGLAALPGREEEFEASIAQALLYARATGARRLHVMAGLADASNPAARNCYRRNIQRAATALADAGVDLLLEPINTRDLPKYFLNDFESAAKFISSLDLPNVKLQFDIYHCQVIHGDVTTRLQRHAELIGHIQIASVPSRHEPDAEELNYPFIFSTLEQLGYSGFIGCEYKPRRGTADGLSWFAPYTAALA